MSKRVLVTGGAGYLGSVLTGRLLEEGYRVTVVDSLLYRQRSLFQHCSNPAFEFVFGDTRDESLMRRLVQDADVIVPLAAIVGAPACDRDPWEARSVNYEAVSLINRLRGHDQLIVYPNTNSGYGTKTGEVFCTEETPLDPITLYGKTKCQAEEALLDTPNTITLRLATVFGCSPRMRIDLLVNHFVLTAVVEGCIVLFERHFKRNYCHIRDIADCFAYCIANGEAMAGHPYNVGLDDANLSKEELALKVKEHVPNFVILNSEIGVDPDKRNYIVSSRRLREAGFEARRSLDEGIRELLKAYRMMARQPFKNV